MPWTNIIAAKLALQGKKDPYQDLIDAIDEIIDILDSKSEMSQYDSDYVDSILALAEPEAASYEDINT